MSEPRVAQSRLADSAQFSVAAGAAQSGSGAAGHGMLLVPEGWQPTSDWFPDTPRCVLATDGESHFVACFYGQVWFEAFSDTEIDSHITHWMELPEMPEGAE